MLKKYDHGQSLKEVLRHAIFKVDAFSLLDKYRNSRGFKTEHLQKQTRTDIFSSIYSEEVWINESSQESRSGLGSEISSTKAVQSALKGLVLELQCKTFLDVGCGDWNWMQHTALPCDYIGIDAVEAVIKQNLHFQSASTSFQVLDAVNETLPQADIAMCREVLFHLSFASTKSVLANLKHSADWLLLTTDTRIWFNSNIRDGDFRLLNLQRPPFSLPAPKSCILDASVSSGRIMGLWKSDDIPNYS